MNPKYITFIFLLFLMGCGYVAVDRNVTIEVEVEKIVYVDRNITVSTNNETPDCPSVAVCGECADGQYSRNYTLGLIRQLKRYERNQDKYFNDSECIEELNQTKIKLNATVWELCHNWNVTWCQALE